MSAPGILHVNTERGWRGGERQTFLLALELARRGYRQWIAVRPRQPLAEALKKEGLPLFPVRPRGEWDVFAAWRMSRWARRENLSILHAHTGHAVGLGAMAKSLSSGGLKMVVTRRVDNPLSSVGFGRWKYRQADAVAAVAKKVADVVIEAGIPSGLVRVVHSGVDRTGYPTGEDKSRLRAERGLSDRDVVVMNAGALVAQKDQATLIRAAGIVKQSRPDVKFVIMGEGPLRPVLEKAVRASGLEETVRLWGHRTDPVACTATADVFVLSSVSEGIGGALIDAMAVGVPTVSTRAGGVADLYESPDAPELVPVGDATALARNILFVLTHPDEARRRVERGRRSADRFTAGAMADAYETMYREVLVKNKETHPSPPASPDPLP